MSPRLLSIVSLTLAVAIPARGASENLDQYERYDSAYVLDCGGQLISSARHRWVSMGLPIEFVATSFPQALEWTLARVGSSDRQLTEQIVKAFYDAQYFRWQTGMTIVRENLGLPAEIDGCRVEPLWVDVRIPDGTGSSGRKFGRKEIVARMSMLDILLSFLPAQTRKSTSGLIPFLSPRGNATLGPGWVRLSSADARPTVFGKSCAKVTDRPGLNECTEVVFGAEGTSPIRNETGDIRRFAGTWNLPKVLVHDSGVIASINNLWSDSKVHVRDRFFESPDAKFHKTPTDGFNHMTVFYDAQGFAIDIGEIIPEDTARKYNGDAYVKFVEESESEVRQVQIGGRWLYLPLNGLVAINLSDSGITGIVSSKNRSPKSDEPCPDQPAQIDNSYLVSGFFPLKGATTVGACHAGKKFVELESGQVKNTIKPAAGKVLFGRQVTLTTPFFADKESSYRVSGTIRKVVPIFTYTLTPNIFSRAGNRCYRLSAERDELFVTAGCTVHAILVLETSR